MSDAESGVRLPAATTSAKGASAKSIRRRLRKFAKKGCEKLKRVQWKGVETIGKQGQRCYLPGALSAIGAREVEVNNTIEDR